MNKEELIEHLHVIALLHSNVGSLADHPCTIAIIALNQCFEDIEKLQKAQYAGSPIGQINYQPYNPEW